LNINTIFIKLLLDTFKDTDFLEINRLPEGLQKGLYDVFTDMYSKLGDNFSNGLGRVSVRHLPPKYVDSFGAYDYDKKFYGGGAIMINIEKYELDVKVTQEYLKQFKGTVLHEIAHHLFTMNSVDYTIKMTMIYNKHQKYFDKRYNSSYIKKLETLKDKLNEIFANCASDYYNGTLDKEISDEIRESFKF
jgi:hypothetical protein